MSLSSLIISAHQLFFVAATKINPNDIGYKEYGTNSDATFQTILNTVYTYAGIVCVLVIIVAGFLYVTAVGRQNVLVQAKYAILSAVVGLGVILTAFIITQFVIGRF